MIYSIPVFLMPLWLVFGWLSFGMFQASLLKISQDRVKRWGTGNWRFVKYVCCTPYDFSMFVIFVVVGPIGLLTTFLVSRGAGILFWPPDYKFVFKGKWTYEVEDFAKDRPTLSVLYDWNNETFYVALPEEEAIVLKMIVERSDPAFICR